MSITVYRIHDRSVLSDTARGQVARDYFVVEGVAADEIFTAPVVAAGLPERGAAHPSGGFLLVVSRTRVESFTPTKHLVQVVYGTAQFGFNIRKGGQTGTDIRPIPMPLMYQAGGLWTWRMEEFPRAVQTKVIERETTVAETAIDAAMLRNIGRVYEIAGHLHILRGADYSKNATGTTLIRTNFATESNVQAIPAFTVSGLQERPLPALLPFERWVPDPIAGEVGIAGVTAALVAGEALPWI